MALVVIVGLTAYASTTGPRKADAATICADLRIATRTAVLLQDADVPKTKAGRAQRRQAILALADKYTNASTTDVVPTGVQANLQSLATLTTRAANALNDPITADKSTGYLRATLPTSMGLGRWCAPYTPPV